MHLKQEPQSNTELFLKYLFIALRCTNVYMNVFIKTVPDTSLHDSSYLT